MKNLAAIKKEINQMAELALSMLKNTFAGFMKHDADILKEVLKDEQGLNEKEKVITLALIEVSQGKNAAEKKNIMLLTEIVADLEEIGDYIKDMIERIEIKIEEKLLFTEDALSEYQHLYSVVETALADTVNALKMDDKNFANRILCGREHADRLVEKYRKTHAARLMAGKCDPRAGNMYLNLLDFTGQIFHHTQSLARNILKLK
jgi:phosphate:Na+ symporter